MPPSTKAGNTKSAQKPEDRREQQRDTPSNRPVHEIRLGRIRAAIWVNSTETGIRYNVTLCRLYKDDKSGEWRDSQSFGRDDLPIVAKVSDMAMMWIYEYGSNNSDSKL